MESGKELKTDCTFSIYSENSPGVLHRVIVLFTRRKINIESLTVSATEREGSSRFTIVINATIEEATKIAKQLRRIVEVSEVSVNETSHLIYKEIAFFRIATPCAATRQDIANRAIRNGASIVAIDPEALVIEKTGTEGEIKALFDVFQDCEVKEFIQSGRIAIEKLHLDEARSYAGEYQTTLQ